jgi:hypothetical protein
LLVTVSTFLYRSVDFGLTWKSTQVLQSGLLWHVDAVDESIIVVGADEIGSDSTHGPRSSLLRSTDGGSSWEIVLRIPGVPGLFAFDFLDRDFGLAALSYRRADGYDGGIVRTTNGGRSWDTTRVPRNILDIAIINSDVAYAVGKDYAVLRTDNGGESWSEEASVPVAAEDRYPGFSGVRLAPDRRTIIAVGTGIIARKRLAEPIPSFVVREARSPRGVLQIAPVPTDGELIFVSLAGSKGLDGSPDVVRITDRVGRTCHVETARGVDVRGRYTIRLPRLAPGVYAIEMLNARAHGLIVVVED